MNQASTEHHIPMGEAFTLKNMVDLGDGISAESIYFERPEKQVICISTQLSCSVGCTFCASPDGNRTTNLTTEQMVIQIENYAANIVENKPLLISFMGEGEPMLNIKNVVDTIITIEDKLRAYSCYMCCPVRYAISTTGPKPQAIDYLAMMCTAMAPFYTDNGDKPNIKLQWSLHSMFDHVRNEIMPLARSVEDIEPHVVAYRDAFGQNSVDINYMLMDGVNDRDIDSYELAKFVNNNGLHLKISRCNEVPWAEYKESKKTLDFIQNLEQLGVESLEYHITDGSKEYAACGQTRSDRKLKLQ